MQQSLFKVLIWPTEHLSLTTLVQAIEVMYLMWLQ